MSKEEQLILVVRKGLLFLGDYFQGFRKASEIDYEARILTNYEWMRRGKPEDKTSAEGNPEFKHPIAYTLIVNPSVRKVFSYQRATQDSRYQERRLQGKWSWGVGGHIVKSDITEKTKNPIHASMLRELEEEVSIPGLIKPRVLGYVNDDRDFVGQVHFGILYIVETQAREVEPKDEEIAQGRLRTLRELEEIMSNPNCKVEGWSEIAFQQLKEILS